MLRAFRAGCALHWNRLSCSALPLAANCSTDSSSRLNDFSAKDLDVDIRKRYNLNRADVENLHQKIHKVVGYGDVDALNRVLKYPGESKTFLASNLDLLNVFGFTDSERRSLLLRSISMFTEDTRTIEHNIGWYVKDLGISMEEFKEMVLSYPPILHFGIDTKVREFVNTFSEFGFSVDQIKTIIVKHPEAIGRDWNKNVLPLMDVLHKHGYRKSDFVTLVSKNPHILQRKAQDRANLIAIMLEGDMTKEEVWKALIEKPDLTLHSFDTNLKQKVEFFKQETGMPCSAVVKNIMVRAPFSFARVRFNTLQKAHACLLSLGFQKEDYRKLITKSPFILGQGPENVTGKVRFLTEYLERGISEIVQWPVYLTFSLEDRIMFRIAALDAQNQDIKKMSLQKLYLAGDAGFFRKFEPGFHEQFKTWWKGLDSETKWSALLKHKYLT